MKKSPAKKSGFTLIEIVIVLAIAALIMVIVFVAVQGAQKSRRDTERRATASRVLASLTNCASDNSGTIGGTVTCEKYISGAGGTGTGALGLAQPTSTTTSVIVANTGACSTTPSSASATNGSTVNVVYWSEGANNIVCLTSVL